MGTTSFEVVYDLKDTTALQDSVPSTMDNQNFAVESLLRDNIAFSDYGTLEQDYFLLDGSMPELPDEPEGIPFWTSELSDSNGNFKKNPMLTILFSENHTSTGLTFHFVGEVPLQMQIRWYDLTGNMIALKSFQPDMADYYARNLVENYGRLEIEFIISFHALFQFSVFCERTAEMFGLRDDRSQEDTFFRSQLGRTFVEVVGGSLLDAVD